MSSVSIEEAKAHLDELIDRLHPGESVTIMRGDKPIATLIGTEHREPTRRRLGTLKGTVRSIAPDFDAPLEDFREYME